METWKAISLGVGAVTVVLLSGLFADGNSKGSDVELGAMSVQRILIAQNEGWDRSAIASIGRESEAATEVARNTIHIENWYRTQIGGRIDYKMIVGYSPDNDLYTLRCFSTEVDEPRRDCF